MIINHGHGAISSVAPSFEHEELMRQWRDIVARSTHEVGWKVVNFKLFTVSENESVHKVLKLELY